MADVRVMKVSSRIICVVTLHLCALFTGLIPASFAQVAPIPPSIPAPAQTDEQTSSPTKPAEPTQGEERVLTASPVLRLKGKSKWEDGFTTLTQAFQQLQAEARRLNITPSGMPHLYFIESDDTTFTYEAYLKLITTPEPNASFLGGVEAGQSPQGRSLVFPYEGAYGEIDAAYEAIAAWMDDKGLVATGSFIEEYLNIPSRPDDPTLRVIIFVFVK